MRRFSTILVCIALIVAVIVPGTPAGSSGAISLHINGRSVPTDVPPVIVDGRTMVPIRVISENLGAAVHWEQTTRRAIITSGANRVVITVDQVLASINGKEVSLDVPATIISGRTMVPIRFVSEALGAAVHWDGSTRTVAVTYAPGGSAVKSLSWHKTPGVARFAVVTNGPVNYKAVALAGDATHPERIWLKLDNTAVEIQSLTPVAAAGVAQVRAYVSASGSGPSFANVVFDLERTVRYSVWATWDPTTPVPLEDVPAMLAPGQQAIVVEVQYQVTGVEYVGDPGAERVVVHLNGPADYQVWEATSPWRIVIDTPRVTLAPGVEQKTIPVGAAGISQVRYAQFQTDPDITRIVLDASLAQTPYSVIQDGDDLVIYFGGTTTITGMGFEDTDAGGRAVLYADRPLRGTVTRQTNPDRLTLVVQGARLGGQLSGGGTLALGDDLVHSVTYTENTNDHTATFAFALNSAAGSGRVVSSETGLTVDVLESELAGKVIVIDPGHGQGDPGAIAPNGAYEATFTYEISTRLAELLREAGAVVYLTRTATENPDRYERPAMANSLGADICVAVHLNANNRSTVAGSETYYWRNHPESRRLAETILAHLVEALGRPNGGARYVEFVATRDPLMPATLVESLYMTNPDDLALIMDPAVRARIAQAIFEGIWEFFSTQ